MSTRKSVIAVDDIRLQNGPCVSLGACSFDAYDYCTWSNVEDDRDDLDWQFGSVKSNVFETGPS